VTEGERRRADFIVAAAGAARFLAEVRAGAERRAADVRVLGQHLRKREEKAGEFLVTLERSLTQLAEAADRGTAELWGVEVSELANLIDDDDGP
jgi:ABC-type transporter Mla subunit MlaD